MKISTLLPYCSDSENIHEIWNDFTATIENIKQHVKPVDVEKFKLNVKMWMNKFLTIYQTKDVTPYMHTFSSHVPESM